VTGKQRPDAASYERRSKDLVFYIETVASHQKQQVGGRTGFLAQVEVYKGKELRRAAS
jgi:hypothetical protein